jgi:hypothetical protein
MKEFINLFIGMVTIKLSIGMDSLMEQTTPYIKYVGIVAGSLWSIICILDWISKKIKKIKSKRNEK